MAQAQGCLRAQQSQAESEQVCCSSPHVAQRNFLNLKDRNALGWYGCSICGTQMAMASGICGRSCRHTAFVGRARAFVEHTSDAYQLVSFLKSDLRLEQAGSQAVSGLITVMHCAPCAAPEPPTDAMSSD